MPLWAKELLLEQGLIPEPVQNTSATVFAPINIALIKYWGKRDSEKHLPQTSSLSLTIGQYGAWTSVRPALRDRLVLAGQEVEKRSSFAQKIWHFIDLIRPQGQWLEVHTRLNIPHSAGLASSASGFAALTRALANLYGWECSQDVLAQIARWGSGSATRSCHEGWVLWPQGTDVMGRDSYGRPLPSNEQVSGIAIGIESGITQQEKPFSSRAMMAQVVSHSQLYQCWGACVARDMKAMRQALQKGDLQEIILVAERNARAMHATMADLPEFYHYDTEKSAQVKQKIYKLRQKGWPISWTQDAGPQVKILGLWEEREALMGQFPHYDFINPVVH